MTFARSDEKPEGKLFEPSTEQESGCAHTNAIHKRLTHLLEPCWYIRRAVTWQRYCMCGEGERRGGGWNQLDTGPIFAKFNCHPSKSEPTFGSRLQRLKFTCQPIHKTDAFLTIFIWSWRHYSHRGPEVTHATSSINLWKAISPNLLDLKQKIRCGTVMTWTESRRWNFPFPRA